ncbi:MAG: hypothetical protein M3285_05630 [Actinomycetota bacterium]|nr:hypothetical protein [Actinomycetota bacterium]
MAIYRPPKPRWPLAIATGALGVLVGLGVGYLLGDKPPDPTDSVRAIRTSLISAAGSLEVAAVEYEESVVDGEVIRAREYEGALAAVRSSRSKLSDVRAALDELAPERIAAIDEGYDEVVALMEDGADATEVQGALDDLRSLLE